ncbi:4-hydroxy-3-methylbut-2-enyl diphosphate reductase [Nocardioides sp. BP30]|uniref:4-hydroxy-3-methylbut-2-enyl diphosphate reductase n=1 Tax=Nocardioides sp. BP30 TaxID=3036374 RepID=UPI002469784F|nr:4-hydroxy-3-methylbut-2-enyl diphosphate reductase [Nocardioides sp. BP30]WGL53027.1 4-hydroxy-3-methylbut-2-enyl diphosphate reductase [Nocardioides sp. BP30]
MTPTILTPLRTEWLAVRSGLPHQYVGTVRRTGRSRGLAAPTTDPVVIAGVAGALTSDLAPGDLVVATRVIDAGTGSERELPAAAMLAGALRRAGLRVHVGAIATTERIVDDPAARAELAANGAIAVDTESALLLQGAAHAVVVRAIVDTPEHRLVSAGTPARGLAALTALRKAAPVLAEWAAACLGREVVMAMPRSFCAGVHRAIDIVDRALDRYGSPVYVRRQIVHNRHVVTDLERKGAIFVEEVEEVPEGSTVVLAAHGVAPSVRADADARRLSVIDATCPLVAKVHAEVRRFAALDHTVFLIGHAEHEEVEGTYGEAPGNIVVVNDAEEARTVEARDPAKVSYVMQTTLAVDEAERTAAVLRERFPALSAPRRDDICYATTNRQQAVRAVARDVGSTGLIIVLGSRNSSNSLRLAEVAQAEGTPAYLVDDLEEIELSWLQGASRVGITAGASAPPYLVDQVVAGLTGLGAVSVREADGVEESVRFTLPREVS